MNCIKGFLLIFFISSSQIFGVTIRDVQYTLNSGSGNECYPSDYNDKTVTLTGVVMATDGKSTPKFYIQTPDSNQWNGIYVYNTTRSVSLTRGDKVSFTGIVDEWYGMTEIKALSFLTVLSSGNPVPEPIYVPTGKLGGGCAFEKEAYEGVLVKLMNVTVIQGINQYGEWYVDDGTGKVQIDDNLFRHSPQVGEKIAVLIGVVNYSFGEYEVNPRDEADIVILGSPPTISHVNWSPLFPLPLDSIKIQANIRDDTRISFSHLHVLRFPSMDSLKVTMKLQSGETYQGVIPAGSDPSEDSLYFRILARDSDGNDTYSDVYAIYFREIDGSYPLYLLHVNDTNGKPVLLGESVSVKGVITVSNQFNNPFFIQDESGGVAIYSSQAMNQAELGNEVSMSGVVDFYSGLTELKNITDFQNIGGPGVPEPQLINSKQIRMEGIGGIEHLEGELFRLENIAVSGDTWKGNSNYLAYDTYGSFQIRIDEDTNIPGNSIPVNAFTVIGVLGQYDNTQPYTSGYQIMPRSIDDIILIEGPQFVTSPTIYDLSSTSISIAWEEDGISTGFLDYGLTPEYELRRVYEDSTTGPYHQVTISNLVPATVYYIRAGMTNETGTSYSGNLLAMTSSDYGSTGEIKVYFNRSVDTTYAFQRIIALGNVDLSEKAVKLIGNANFSIDACLYSLSLQNVKQALINAHNRGVAIRFIYDDDHNQPAVKDLIAAGIPVIDDSYGNNNGSGLQHNKFLIIDARDGSSVADDYVWTGSFNFTYEGLTENIQNVVVIQDQALAKAYTMEFNEMWGSVSDTPNPDSSRFGNLKSDNIPHKFLVGGRWVEFYTSPSDGVADKIIRALRTADRSIHFAILTFTSYDISGEMYKLFRSIDGFEVRGIFDSGESENPSSQWFPMSGNAAVSWDPPADVYLDAEAGLLHHKYMVIDGFSAESEPAVITGSYNWTYSADYKNNENLLIIWDKDIAGLYLQEFAARYFSASSHPL
ncbi:MAG: phospholipase D-like domain-containing protein, partial [Fidelibacterota bacterium]